MSLNVSGSKFIRVYDPTIRLNFSDKVLFANLQTSRKTGNVKEVNGKEVQERAFSRWEARFVGNAFEASKGLKDGDTIDIVNGWVTNEPYKGKDDKTHYRPHITITEFALSEIADGENEDVAEEVEGTC